MSQEETLKAAVLAWQKKHGVNDNDPLLATIELFQIHFSNWQGHHLSSSSGSSYDEFRGSFEELSRRTRALSKQTEDLMAALRTMPDLTKQLRAYRRSILWTIGAVALCAGIGIGIGVGKFLPL